LIAGVCRIVGAAHRKDIVHRDLKPANILVSSPNDEPFVLDFGIARCLRETRLTRGSQGPGTVPYQAPEQVDEELQRPGLESLIDVWAIGVVLYRTATRAYPFEAKGVFNVQKMILEAEPKSPRALNPDVPEALEDLVIDCLSKNPARRPATMDEVADRLRAIFPTTSASSSSSSSSAARRRGKTNVEAFAPPPWFDVVAATPDPAVVKDAEARARIAATGRPWRVRDKASGVEFLLAPPGEFFRGSLPNEGEADERPARMVRVARAFYLSATPVTQVDYARVVGKNPSRNKGDDRLPVEQVSYQDAVAFCARVGARLPTEAEWEYACRAGSDAQRYGPSDEVGWYRDNAGGGTKPVGLKAANAFGFHDMLGDVYEWCADWYDAEEYRKRADGDVAGAGPERGERRVIRGGAWNFPETNMRAAARGRWRPERAEAFIGFRIARDP
jgi:formylglycine-generating enzyme required for sulfatase activity